MFKKQQMITVDKHNREIFELKEAHISALAKKDKDALDLRVENASLKKEAELLNKAFDEIGVTVTDTKDIIDKLLKTIGQKTDINIVK